MNLTKPYKYALLAAVFVVSSAAGYLSVSSGVLPEYLRDEVIFAAMIVGGITAAIAGYRRKQACQVSS